MSQQLEAVPQPPPSSKKQKCMTCFEKVGEIISFMSVGKYSTKLYHRGRSDYSCCLSGLLTMVLALIILLSSISILSTTFNKGVHTLTESTIPLNQTDFYSLTLLELEDQGIKPPMIRTAPMNLNNSDPFQCADVVVNVLGIND